ncbi:MAG: sodium-dependent transporter [Nitrospira sp.]|nr:sodium-dependent transporter [bacterium]MBL7048137.1 sodium-dependent transporter [Nitrospira sp.]
MKREQWNSQFGFLLAAIGSAIGLGNIWRFSYLAYSNGGGAFLIPYIVALLTAGISLLILEFAIGHERIGSAPLAFAKINGNWEWLGWWSVIFVMFGIELYYSVVISWCVNFFFFSFDLAWGSDPNAFFFNEFLKLNTNPLEVGEIRTPILLALILVWFANWIVVYRGVKKGIELANKIFMPLLFVLMAILVFWSLTLEGAVLGVKAYLTPDFSKLTDPKVWIDAYSQIFFTLSLGFGIMIAYASYLPAKANITKMAVLTAVINSGFSIFAGFAVFATLGFMAQSQNLPIDEVVTKSIGLAFVAYPKAVSLMPGGNFFGVIFFLSLIIAGLSSSISIIEAFTSAVIDKFGYKRKPLVSVICVAGFLGSIIFTTQAGLIWLDIVDHFLTHYGLISVGIAECILVGWFFRTERLRRHLNKISSIKLGPWWDFLIRFFVPIVLSIILLGDLYQEIKTPYEGYSWISLILIGRDWIMLTLIAAFMISLRSWRTGQKETVSRIEDQS